MDSYTTETYMIHDKGIQVFYKTIFKWYFLSFSENIVYKQIVELSFSRRLWKKTPRGSAKN